MNHRRCRLSGMFLQVSEGCSRKGFQMEHWAVPVQLSLLFFGEPLLVPQFRSLLPIALQDSFVDWFW